MMKNQRKWFGLLLTAVLVCLMVCSLPVWADDVIEDEDKEEITGYVEIIGAGTEADGGEISGYEENKVGILASADGDITVKKGDITTFFGGVLMTTSENGKIDLTVGTVSGGYDAPQVDPEQEEDVQKAADDTENSEGAEGGFGIAASLDGGTINANAISIDAAGSFGLNVWADNNSTAAFTITGDAGDSTTKDAAGAEDPEEEVITGGGGIFAAAEGVSLTADNGSKVTVETESIEAGGIGADLAAENGGTIELTADEIFAEETAVSIDASGSGSSVTVDSFDLSAQTLGLEVYAENSAEVKVKTNEGSVIAELPIDVENQGGTVTLNTGALEGFSGLSVISGSGSTTVETTDTITVENYGVLINVTDLETAETADPSDAAGSSSGAAPTVTVTVGGDILGDVKLDPEEGEGIPEPVDPDDPGDREPAAKAAGDEDAEIPLEEWEVEWPEDNDGWTDKDPGEGGSWSEEEWVEDETASGPSYDPAGVIVGADAKGSTVAVDVQGRINMPYGNDLFAENTSTVTLKVKDNVETLYGNRIAAMNDGTVSGEFGNDINAGGQALDTLAYSGTVKVNVAGNINATDAKDSDPYTSGIYADSAGTGTTDIKVGKGIAVKSTEANYAAYGIDVENTGGTMTIEVKENLSVIGVEAVGLEITNDPESSDYEEDEEDGPESEQKAASETGGTGTLKTTVTIGGNITVTGTKNGTGAEIWDSGELDLKVGTRDDTRDPDSKAPAGINASGSPSTGMTVVSDGKTNIEIFGDVKGDTYGLKVDTDVTEEDDVEISEGKMDILVSETISGGKQSLMVNKDVTADQLDLTVWEIVPVNKDAALTPDGGVNQPVEDSIKYIIRIAPDSQDKITVVDKDGKELPKSHDYPYANQGNRIYVRSADGSELTAVYNGKCPRQQTSLQKGENGFYLDVPKGGAVWLSVNQNPRPEPEPSDAPNSIDFYRIGDLSWLFDRRLPGTGFSASYMTQLPARPQSLSYGSTGLMLQIPELGVAENIITVPNADGEYPVEWLGSSIGLLEQSSLPGRGVAVLTGHNHLNNTEAGPFLSLGSLESGARMMVSGSGNDMQTYRVYGNYKIASDGFASIASEVRENALVLITCEDEAVDGGYLNRRVILAEPL